MKAGREIIPLTELFSGDWSCWGDTRVLLSPWAYFLDNKGEAVCYWKVLRMVTEEWPSSNRPEMPFAMKRWQAPSFSLLCLSPRIKVVSWQAEHKNLNHCSLIHLLSFLTTTELHKARYTLWFALIYLLLFVLNYFLRRGYVSCTLISMSNCVAHVPSSQAPPGCFSAFSLTRKGWHPPAESFLLSPGSC